MRQRLRPKRCKKKCEKIKPEPLNVPNKGHGLKPGDFVEVRSPAEILDTLDENGTLDGMPFMPEMIAFCNRRFLVLRRLEKTCYDASPMEVRQFKNNDVVYLQGIFCSGGTHNGCQKACRIFWKEAWLRKVDGNNLEESVAKACGAEKALEKRLRTKRDESHYFCQSTEIVRSTHPLSRSGRLKKCVRDVQVGTYGVLETVKWIVLPLFRKLVRAIRGNWPVGIQKRTQTAALGLQPGEWVEVKPIEEIIQTLDVRGRNRGLVFEPDMVDFCGKKLRVRNRLDRMIIEQTGEMRELKNTVILEGVPCGCVYSVGGCPRNLFQYWREIWLRRIESEQ